MSTRRTYGTGGISQDKSTGYWVVTIEDGWTENGTRKRIKRKFKTLAEARKGIERLRIQRARGELSRGSKLTLKRYADRWVEDRRHQVRPKTLATDITALDNWIIPLLGNRALGDITPADVRMVATRALESSKRFGERGVTPATARRYQATLMRILTQAQEDGLFVQSATLSAKIQATGHTNRQAMPAGEAVALMRAASEANPAWFVRAALSFLLGLRPGEARAVTWQAVDLQAGTIEVAWQMQALRYAEKGNLDSGFLIPAGYEAKHLAGAQHLVRPKTTAGFRVLPVIPWLAQVLTTYKAQWEPNEWGLLFTHKGKPLSDTVDRSTFEAFQEQLDIRADGRPYTLHEMRHTCATLLMSAGVDPEVIKQILGHSDVATQAAYKHADITLAAAAITSVSDLLQLQA